MTKPNLTGCCTGRSAGPQHFKGRSSLNFTDAELDAALREAVALAQEPA